MDSPLNYPVAHPVAHPVALPFFRRGPRLISEHEISLGDAHIATKDGEAMFFHDSIDFSGYEGTDAGYTPYYLEFIDNAGLVAAAYAGAQGGGETLGSELITDGDCEAALPTFTTIRSNFTQETDIVYAGSKSGKVTSINANGSCRIYTGISNLDIHYIEAAVYLSNGCPTIRIGSYLGTYPDETSVTETWVVLLGHLTDANFVIEGTNIPVDEFFYVDNISVKKLTDVPTTGLHLMSTKNGTTRNMASIETGFNPNKIAEIRVWRV